MKERIAKYIENYVGSSIDDENEDLIENGLVDSLMAMNLLVSLEKEFNIKFSFAEYSKPGFLTVHNISHAIASRSPS